VWIADAGVQQAEVVVEFGDGPDRRAGVVGGVLLVDGDGRREPLDVLDLRLVHLAEKVARVRGQRFDVAALALGVHRLEGERGLARPRQARDDGKGVARNLDIDVLEVVFFGPTDLDVVFTHYANRGTRERKPCRSRV
jgi:hypothetical protein